MFRHESRLQYDARPERPDAAFAKLLQEILAGQASETTAMVQYLYQGCNCRGPAKYRDMLMATAAEEVGHVEMVATMIARLLEKAPVTEQEAAAAGDPVVHAVMGGMHPQHFLTAGLSALPRDSAGNPWNASFVWGTGNLLADFRANVALESTGRLNLCRLYQLSGDRGVREMLAFLIARDTMHQNQFLAAVAELEAGRPGGDPGAERVPARGRARRARVHVLEPDRRHRRGRRAVGPREDARRAGEVRVPQAAQAARRRIGARHVQPARARHRVQARAPGPEAGHGHVSGRVTYIHHGARP
jgi:Mn-containing catalase